MKLSISNIAWDQKHDEEMYGYLQDIGFDGLEIAPTRFVSEHPYDRIDESVRIAEQLKANYDLEIASMQSIWFGRTENIFSSREEREILIAHTIKAISYAKAIRCRNLVFGSPKNRNIDDFSRYDVALEFFSELGAYASDSEVVIALEPNPSIYHTNFLNYTKDAIQFVKEIGSKGLMVNLDLGTVIWNSEDLESIFREIHVVNHVHISEPYLESIKARGIHGTLKELLKQNDYSKYVSIEMKNTGNLDVVKEIIRYTNGIMR